MGRTSDRTSTQSMRSSLRSALMRRLRSSVAMINRPARRSLHRPPSMPAKVGMDLSRSSSPALIRTANTTGCALPSACPPDETRSAGRERLIEWARGREQRKGLRPRDAAIPIVIVWFVAIAVFGIVEHLVEPKTFQTVWLGMWWALVTVTTVGYGMSCRGAPAGRIVAPFLLLGGLAFLTVIIAMITGGFVARYQHPG